MRKLTKDDIKRDKSLFRVLLLLNIVSGSTTIRGALQILPNAVGLPAGLTVQALLLLLLSGNTAKHAPKRKWIAVSILSVLSAYTSFFTYYETLIGNQKVQLAIDKAHTAHEELVMDIYTPIRQDLNFLHQNYQDAKRKTEEEIDNGFLSGGGSGYGDVARTLKAEELEQKRKYEELKALVNDLQPKFEYSLENLTPEQIYLNDESALARVPEEYLTDDVEIERSNYIDADQDVALLTPVYKIKDGVMEAITAMVIALTLDSLIIMLGTAIVIKPDSDKKTSKPIWEKMASFAAGQMRGGKGFVETLKQESQKPSTTYTKTLDLEQLGVPLKIIRSLRGKSSSFLLQLYNATHPSTRVVNFDELQKHAGEAVLVYRMLLDNLMSPGLGWVTPNHEGQWIVVEHHYFEYTQWLQKEISRHIELEKASLDGDRESTVTIEVPAISTK